MQTAKKKTVILHPFLIAAYPVIALLAHNIEEVKPVVALRALIISISASILIYILLRALIKDVYKSALITSLVVILFFSYGHVYDFLEQANPLALVLGRHRILAPLWGILLVLAVVWIWRSSNNLSTLNQVFNWVAIAALIMPTIQLGIYAVQTTSLEASASEEPLTNYNLKLPITGQPPDVYYIILDAYARDDVLLQDHGLDNRPLLSELEDLGFFIARCSQSNYAQTQLSLSSSLNMDYLPSISENITPENTSRLGLNELIRHGQVRQAFESLGYTTIAFETGFKYTQWEDADIYYSPSASTLNRMQIGGGLNDFESLVFKTSAGLLLTDSASLLPKYLQADFNNPRRIHRERILFDLDQLSKIPEIPGPKFVFAHLVSPHPPYVFGPDGEFTDFDLEAKTGYINQIKYLNQRLVPLLKEIIENSAVPPIIIIQGDHGAIHSPASRRMNIFNVYHFPDDGARNLYEQISPVNTFRVVLDTFFGGEFPMLEDTSFFSDYKNPYNFTIIPNGREGCRN